MLIWFMVNERTREALARRHKEDAGCKYIPPDESDCVLRVSIEIGDTEEADRQMRIASKVKRRPS